MKLILDIAVTHVSHRARQTLVAVAGVMTGVGFSIMMASLMEGSQDDFMRLLIDALPHITVSDERRNPTPQPAGKLAVQTIMSSPETGASSVRVMYCLAISSARRTIDIANPYFVPNTLAVRMLVEAQRRGVDVEIIVPGPILDASVVRRASRAKWGPLLEAGVKIYEYQPTFYHTKVIVVDD